MIEKRPVGRPVDPNGYRRGKQLSFRVKKQDYTKLIYLAKQKGITISEYIRRIINTQEE